MKHVCLFTALLLASVSSHAACPVETPYVAPVDMQPQCEPPTSTDSASTDESDSSDTSSDDSNDVMQTAKPVPDNNSTVASTHKAQ